MSAPLLTAAQVEQVRADFAARGLSVLIAEGDMCGRCKERPPAPPGLRNVCDNLQRPSRWAVLDKPCDTCRDLLAPCDHGVPLGDGCLTCWRDAELAADQHQQAGRKCPNCGSRNVWCVDSHSHFVCKDCHFGCDCRDGRQVWELRTACPGCKGSGVVSSGYPNYDGLACDDCYDNYDAGRYGSVLVARATIQVVPVVADEPGLQLDGLAVIVDGHGAWLSNGDPLPLDPLPVPGRHWGVVLREVRS